jgi:hypothetical protein
MLVDRLLELESLTVFRHFLNNTLHDKKQNKTRQATHTIQDHTIWQDYTRQYHLASTRSQQQQQAVARPIQSSSQR